MPHPSPGSAAQAATGPAWEGWLQPPAYTGKPTLYLADQVDEALILPVGTKISLRFYGEPGTLILAEQATVEQAARAAAAAATHTTG